MVDIMRTTHETNSLSNRNAEEHMAGEVRKHEARVETPTTDM